MSRLQIEGLEAGRDGFRIGPLSLSTEPGSTVAMIGPNGGGKTTLLKTVAGLIRPLAGAVRVDGRDVVSAPASRRAELVAYLPPPGEVEAPFRTAHVVALGRLSRRRWPADITAADQAAARAALDSLNIGHLADRPFDRLSSGQRQLALIGRLLAQDARVCLLDEPEATLDPARRSEVRAALRTLTEAGRVVVFSTHDLAQAAGATLCVAVGPDAITVGRPKEVMTPTRLGALYGLAQDFLGLRT